MRNLVLDFRLTVPIGDDDDSGEWVKELVTEVRGHLLPPGQVRRLETATVTVKEDAKVILRYTFKLARTMLHPARPPAERPTEPWRPFP